MALSIPVTERDHILGGKAAGVTLVEYGDYECSYCALAQPIIGQLLTDFCGAIEIRLSALSLTEIHSQAEGAAEFAELAAKQGKFWEVHEALYANQTDLGIPLYFELGKLLGVSEQDITASLESRAFATNINQDLQGGLCSGVDGTPAFFINGQRHGGTYQYEDLRTAIGAALG